MAPKNTSEAVNGIKGSSQALKFSCVLNMGDFREIYKQKEDNPPSSSGPSNAGRSTRYCFE
jgi:hypothetical protein